MEALGKQLGQWLEHAAGAQLSPLTIAVAVVAVALALLGLVRFVRSVQRFARRAAMLRPMESIPNGNFFLGHVLPMLLCTKRGLGAWDMLKEATDNASSPIIKFRILDTHCVVFKHPLGMKRVFQTAYKIYEKDLKLSYLPFLPILGTGLVTADGDLWQKQRILMGPALRYLVIGRVLVGPSLGYYIHRVVMGPAPWW